MRASHHIGALFVTLLLGALTYAAPVPGLSVPTLVRDSDVIVLGNIDETTRVASETTDAAAVDLWEAEVTVDQMLKGADDRRRIRCRFVMPTPSNAYAALHAGEYQLLFLRREQDHYVPTSRYYPSITVVPLPPIREASPIDSVAAALERTLAAPSCGTAMRMEVVRQLGTIQTAHVHTTLHRLVREDLDARVQQVAAAALLRRNDLLGLPIAASALSSVTPDDAQLRSEILMAIGEDVASADVIPAIAPLLNSSSPDVRRAAALALRHSRSRGAVPHLIRALDDENGAVRYTAVMGLAEITGDLPHGPSIALFRADEGKYLTYWREWGRAHR